MVNVEIRKGFFDEKLKVADIICFCPSSCGTVTHYVNRRPMKVTHVNETVMEIFEVTGFMDILTIE